MRHLELKPGFFWNGILDKDLRVFDIIMETEFGTTYNSYLLKGSEKTALFETAKEPFFDDYLANIEEVVSVAEIDYIIVNHTEPDHAGSAAKLLSMNPDITIVGTAGALGFLRQIVNHDFKQLAVKENDVLSLGDKTLRFMVLPNLHWPDTMYTYLEEDQVLLTCDSFGAHYCHEGILRSTVTNEGGYINAAKYYFDNIIGPFKNPFMTKALTRIRELPLSMICPGHGPVLDSHIDDLKDLYQSWCQIQNPNPKTTVVIPFVSAYGYTQELAEQIKAGIESAGDIDVHLYDMVTAEKSKVIEAMKWANGILFGSPTILNDALEPIWELLAAMTPVTHKGKHAGAFGSYGWSGEAVPNIMARLTQLKLKVDTEGYRVRFRGSQEELEGAFEFGRKFAEKLL